MKSRKHDRPRYNHLLEVLDGAAALHMAIRNAECALKEIELTSDERSLLEEVLDASRERHARVAAILGDRTGVDGPGPTETSPDPGDFSQHDLEDAARAADEGSEEAERLAVKAIDRLGRSLKLDARASIETFLSHSSPMIRASAIKVLALHWRLRDYTDRVLWSLASDTEPECRRAAALALGSLYEGTRDREIGKELISALRREHEQDVQWASYYALLIVDGTEEVDRPLPIHDFDAPHDVDPAILSRYN